MFTFIKVALFSDILNNININEVIKNIGGKVNFEWVGYDGVNPAKSILNSNSLCQHVHDIERIRICVVTDNQ